MNCKRMYVMLAFVVTMLGLYLCCNTDCQIGIYCSDYQYTLFHLATFFILEIKRFNLRIDFSVIG